MGETWSLKQWALLLCYEKRNNRCKYEKILQLKNVGLPCSLQFIGVSLDRIASCLCCSKFWGGIKCSSSISYTSPRDTEIPFIDWENNEFKA